MLDEMEPRQFAEWHAYWLVEPWGDPWRQVGRLGSVLHNDMLYLRAANGETIEEDDWLTEDDFIPHVEEEADDEPTLEEMQELLKDWYGPHW